MNVSYVQQNSPLFAALDERLPGAAWLGIMDFSNTFMVQLQSGTPIGWRWIPIGLNRKGKKAQKKGYLKGKGSAEQLRTEGFLKRGTGRWIKSGAARKAWQKQVDQAGRGITFNNPQTYLFVLERGLYPNPPKGPMPHGEPWAKGWRVTGGYSRQAEKGIVKPLFADDKLWQQASRVITKRINEMLDSLSGGNA